MADSNGNDAHDAREYRFKQLDYLLKFLDGEAILLMRITQILILGNGAAAGLMLVFLRDLKGKIGDEQLLKAFLIFVAGVFLSGAGQTFHVIGSDRPRNASWNMFLTRRIFPRSKRGSHVESAYSG